MTYCITIPTIPAIRWSALTAIEAIALAERTAVYFSAVAGVTIGEPHPVPGHRWAPVAVVDYRAVTARNSAAAENHRPAAVGDVRTDSAGPLYPWVVYSEETESANPARRRVAYLATHPATHELPELRVDLSGSGPSACANLGEAHERLREVLAALKQEVVCELLPVVRTVLSPQEILALAHPGTRESTYYRLHEDISKRRVAHLLANASEFTLHELVDRAGDFIPPVELEMLVLRYGHGLNHLFLAQ